MLDPGSPLRQSQNSSTETLAAGMDARGSEAEKALKVGWDKLVDANIRSGMIACMWCLKTHVLRRTAQAFHKWRGNCFLKTAPSASPFISQTASPIYNDSQTTFDQRVGVLSDGNDNNNVPPISTHLLTGEKIRAMTVTDAELDRRRAWLLNYASNLVLGIRGGGASLPHHPGYSSPPNPTLGRPVAQRLLQQSPVPAPFIPSFSYRSFHFSRSPKKSSEREKSPKAHPAKFKTPSNSISAQASVSRSSRPSFMAPTHSFHRKKTSTPPPFHATNAEPTQRFLRDNENVKPAKPLKDKVKNKYSYNNEENDSTRLQGYRTTRESPNRAYPPYPPQSRQSLASYLQPTHSFIKKTMHESNNSQMNSRRASQIQTKKESMDRESLQHNRGHSTDAFSKHSVHVRAKRSGNSKSTWDDGELDVYENAHIDGYLSDLSAEIDLKRLEDDG